MARDKPLLRHAGRPAPRRPLFELATAILLALAATVAGAAARAQGASPLTPVARDGVAVSAATSLRFAAGRIDPLATRTIEKAFVVRNAGAAPVTVERIQSSCGCASAFIGSRQEPNADYVIEPGNEASVRVAIDVGHLHAGPIDKFVWLYARGFAGPAATLELTAEIAGLLSFSPQTVSFGRVRAGDTREVTITATMDARLLGAGSPPTLACSDPDVRVSLLSSSAPAAGAEGQRLVTRTYRCALSPDAHLGVLTGSVVFIPPQSTGPADPARDAMIAALGTASAAIAGEVAGSISASPATIVFGTVTSGQPASRRVTITGESEDALAGLKVANTGPWLAARIQRAPDSPAGGAQAPPPPRSVLTISVLPSMPLGGVQTQIVLETRERRRLILPVILSVVAPAAK